MKKIIVFLAVFIFVCLCGAFCMLAGGTKWGTADCGFGCFLVIAAGAFLGAMLADCSS